ncbi:MAG: hypothetical protein HY080_00510 [Gammaproteobacteria bacterium]|nr:hypothetical protein [Gammaproteobacteria bacterium]
MHFIGTAIFVFGLFPSFTNSGLVEHEKSWTQFPEVWGYELPIYNKEIRNVHPRLFKMPDGDILITYVSEPIQTLKLDNTCCEDAFLQKGIGFFTKRTVDFTLDEYDDFFHDSNNPLLKPDKKIQLSNGDTIEVSGNPYNCYKLINHALVKKNPQGKVLLSKLLLYRNQTPRRLRVDETCDDTKPRTEIDARIENVDPGLVKLDDNNFLVYEASGGNLVIRFDAELNTKFHSDNLFIVEQGWVDGIKQQLVNAREYSEQSLHDTLDHTLTRAYLSSNYRAR